MNPDATERFQSVWDAIEDTPEQAANLRVRAALMAKVGALIQRNGWTQAEAANHCGVSPPQIDDLVRGRISRFSLSALVNMAAKLGPRLHVDPEAA